MYKTWDNHTGIESRCFYLQVVGALSAQLKRGIILMDEALSHRPGALIARDERVSAYRPVIPISRRLHDGMLE